MTDDLYQEVVPGDLIYNDGEVGVVYGETPSGEIRYLCGKRRYRRADYEEHIELEKTYSRANHYNFKITEDQLRHYLTGPQWLDKQANIDFNNKIIEKVLEAQQEILNQ